MLEDRQSYEQRYRKNWPTYFATSRTEADLEGCTSENFVEDGSIDAEETNEVLDLEVDYLTAIADMLNSSVLRYHCFNRILSTLSGNLWQMNYSDDW